MNIRPKTKQRLAILVGIALAIALCIGLLVRRSNALFAAMVASERAAGMEAYRNGDFAAALPHLSLYLNKTRASSKRPESADAQAIFAYGRSRQNVPSGRFDHLVEAKETFQTYLTLRPGDLDAQHALLTIYTQLGYHKEASGIADDVLASHPDDVEALRRGPPTCFARPARRWRRR